MGVYKLNNIDLSTFGFIPGKIQNSNVALSGFMDMPARLGKTFHDWGDENGIEPYVSAGQIRFEGRDLQLVGFIKGTSKIDCLNKQNSLINLVNSFNGLVTLNSKWGDFQILVKSIPVEYISDTIIKVTINMREPVVNLSGVIPVSDNADYGIDSISFKNLGGVLTKFSGDRRGRPVSKSQQVTSWQNEGFQVTKSEAGNLELTLFINVSTYVLFKEKITGLYALFSAPGTRLLTVENDLIRDFFVTEGFKVENLFSRPNRFFGSVSFSAIQVNNDFYFLTDNAGNFITDNSLNKIIIR